MQFEFDRAEVAISRMEALDVVEVVDVIGESLVGIGEPDEGSVTRELDGASWFNGGWHWCGLS